MGMASVSIRCVEESQSLVITVEQQFRKSLDAEGGLIGVMGEANVPAGETTFAVHYRVRRGGAEPVTHVGILLDGRPVGGEAPIPASDTADASASIPLPAKDAILTVLAENRLVGAVEQAEGRAAAYWLSRAVATASWNSVCSAEEMSPSVLTW